MDMIDKQNRRYQFLKGSGKLKENEKVVPIEIQDGEARRENMKRLFRYKRMWDAMAPYRARRRRIRDYERGRQWNDLIKVGDKTITEAQHIMDQGKNPMINNIMQTTLNSILGEYRRLYTKNDAIARTKDNQTPSESMTAMLHFVLDTNEIEELDVSSFAEGLRSGLVVHSTDFHFHSEHRRNEIQEINWNPARVILPTNIEDARGEDIRSIGVLMDMTLDELIRDFAKSDKDEENLRKIYRRYTKDSLTSWYSTFASTKRNDNLDFFIPRDADMCRVIQMWEQESEDCWMVIDHFDRNNNGIYPKEDGPAIDKMIAARNAQIAEEGLEPEKSEIEKIKYNDIFWYVRYFSPYGDILYEGRSPFAHQSHPFSVYLARLVDGEIYSFEESIIDQQRYINRLTTLIDFIISSSAKGVLVFPENAIPKGMTKEELLDDWRSFNGVIFANIKPGMPLPQQISQNSTNIGANELLAMQMQLVRDISGIHGAMLGKEAKSGVSGNLYSQEAANAQTNLLDIIRSFDAFRRRRDLKIVKTIPQCYDYMDYIPLVGRDYSEAAKMWDATVAGSFDYYIKVVTGSSGEVYEMELNKLITAALQQQLIDFKTALRAGRFPFSDKVLNAIERAEEDAIKKQAEMQAQQMRGQAIGANMAENGASEAQMLEAGAQLAQQVLDNPDIDGLNNQANQSDPRTLAMIQQALAQ